MSSIRTFRTAACLMAAVAAMLMPPRTLPAQTRVDLRTQAKSADLSALGATRPVQTGTALPATCAVGALFFRLDTLPGQNLYGCTATNIWTRLFQTSSDTFSATFSNLTVLLLAKTTHGLETANIGVDCYNMLYSHVQPVAVSVDSTTLDVQITFNAPTSGRCFLTAGDRSNSAGSSAAVDGGLGIVVSESNGVKTLSLDTAVVPTMMTGSQILVVGSLQPGGCFEGSVRLPGAALGDGVAPGWPPQIPASMTGLMWIRTPGAVAVRLCNSGTAASPAFTETFRTTLVRSF
jgi:hypothetical protein